MKRILALALLLFSLQLSAPYLLFLNKNGNLSHVYVLPKNGNMDFGELYTSFN